ncbi:DUF5994 family protein [Nocardia sp. NPDC005366]|uniref:DUF5994 family protein n=1 Tax=Nocardia sp. NPDC005366 TaxID=3156878 RepID=UPI0033B3CE80
MATSQIHRPSARHRVPPEFTPRLRLKPKAERNGYIDGAWWPRSEDLTTELPDLLAVLSVGLGPVWRVVYDPACWTQAPARMTVDGRAVRLDAYRFERWNTMYVFGRDSGLIVLRVIPSATDENTAHAALMATVVPDPTALAAG